MLELLDTGRMAHKHGKWRGAIALIYAIGAAMLATVFEEVVNAVSGFSNPSHPTNINNPVIWIIIGLYAIALLLMLFGIWQLYKDFEHASYVQEADRYKQQGW